VHRAHNTIQLLHRKTPFQLLFELCLVLATHTSQTWLHWFQYVGSYNFGCQLYCLWLPCVADADIIFLSCFYLFSSPNLSGHRLDVYHTSTHHVVLVWIYNTGRKCAAQARWKCMTKKSPSGHHCTTLSGYIFKILPDKVVQWCPDGVFGSCISTEPEQHIFTTKATTIGKNLLNSNVSPTCPHNMVNFGPLAA